MKEGKWSQQQDHVEWPGEARAPNDQHPKTAGEGPGPWGWEGPREWGEALQADSRIHYNSASGLGSTAWKPNNSTYFGGFT